MVPTVERGERLGAFLVYGNDWREPFNEVDIGALYVAYILAGIGGEGFHEAPLAFGIDGVEGEAGFPGAAESGNDHKPVARDLE